MKELDDLLGIDRTQTSTALEKVEKNYLEVFSETDERFNNDFEDIRESIKSIISETRTTVKALNIIARDTEKAADFNALSNLTKTLLEANKQLIEMYSVKRSYHKDIPASNDKGSPVSIGTMNAIFTGTTKDLKKYHKIIDNEEE